jgi:SSS family solute:Na+ symporter
VNLYALALVMQALLGWPLWTSIALGAFIVLAYITVGGLSSAIYNEVLQFFVILAGLIPIVVIGLVKVGGIDGLFDKVRDTKLGEAGLHAWADTGSTDNPLGAHWFGIVFGLGFVLSFGYWTTNFAEVQRALSAKNMSAARRTPIIAAYPKMFIPLLTIIPGLIALVTIDGLGAESGDLQYNNAIPLLMRDLLPNGVLGIAVTGLLASFMAGMAANVSGFNTVFTYDIWQTYIRKDRPDDYYIRVGRIATVAGVCVGIGTAFIAAGFSNIMNYIQALFSVFNAPLFATFIIGMFWKRMSPLAGFWSLLAGTVVALGTYLLYLADVLKFNSDLSESFWGAGLAFVTVAIVAAAVTPATRPRPDEDLRGLVYGTAVLGELDAADRVWWRNPVLLGLTAVVLSFLLYIPVW